MGFLDHSTNNIILDAVLTDIGRQFLARNNGSFSIQKFALGDDEINYGIITKYGRTIGKEKIEKNTPIFEALTNQQHALKYKLVSVSNPNLLKLPGITLTSGLTDTAVLLGRTTTKTKALSLEQQLINENTIEPELVDQVFSIEVPNLFLSIEGDTPDTVDGKQIATYTMPKSKDLSWGGSGLNFTLSVKTLNDALFTVYGTTTNKSIIQTYIKVTGLQSGASEQITVTINKNL